MSITTRQSYSDLTPLERVLVSVPKRIHNIDIERAESGCAVVANVEALDTIKMEGAYKKLNSDGYIVSFDNY